MGQTWEYGKKLISGLILAGSAQMRAGKRFW